MTTKYFIFWICPHCGQPMEIINPSKVLGKNDFPFADIHGNMTGPDTEILRTNLIKNLKDIGMVDKANLIEKNTKVLVCHFNINTSYGFSPFNPKE